MLTLFDIVQAIPAESQSATGDQVYRRFQDEAELPCIALLDESGAPVGIIERNTFFLRMAAEFGRALYATRPISGLMNTRPLVVDGEQPLMEFCAATLQDQALDLMQGFIVTRAGRYVGVGSALNLLQATSRSDRERATQMTQLAARLDRARGDAQTALEAKARFLTVMSHELRTPLNGVLTVAEILEMKMGEAGLKPYVKTIQTSGKQLLRLVNDVLDLSRQGFEDLAIDCTAFSLGEVARQTADLWSGEAAKKGLALSAHFDGNEEALVLGDAGRLRQVLDNLVENAVKFTSTGRIAVEITAREETSGWRVTATVSDTGPGVPPESLEAIFTPFSALAMAHDRGGAGMGLAIARLIVMRMGGQIVAEGNAEGGLSVRISLPAPAAPKIAVAA